MIRYAVVNPTTGEILRTGACAPEDALKQASPGTDVVTIPEQATVDDSTHSYDAKGRCFRAKASAPKKKEPPREDPMEALVRRLVAEELKKAAGKPPA